MSGNKAERKRERERGMRIEPFPARNSVLLSEELQVGVYSNAMPWDNLSEKIPGCIILYQRTSPPVMSHEITCQRLLLMSGSNALMSTLESPLEETFSFIRQRGFYLKIFVKFLTNKLWSVNLKSKLNLIQNLI